MIMYSNRHSVQTNLNRENIISMFKVENNNYLPDVLDISEISKNEVQEPFDEDIPIYI